MSTTVSTSRRCTTCERDLDPERDFQVKERDATGAVIRRFSSCRRCRVTRVRARLADSARLPVEPFRSWLAHRLQDEGVWDATSWAPVPYHRAPRSIEVIAQDWGTSAKRIQDILKGRVLTIGDDYADRVFTAAGCPHLLGILYELPDEQIAA